ncbi:tRNA dihydrouridine(20/20a) synthase DusA [Buchnera aphidicola]|uniref:tRNA-dihydrouridine synthase n=1 Tax=Buchnera aphidicola (Cinara strobi) TaxID=1921549 RepID=A0A3B1E9N1_9GAMM|nr:tRNA dihydrouridine(20/20a) synthase DusA [Buchnera aphidicola]VAX76859.1 tRNA-dihydrouridine(20/20a) synthase [Buchnera aphidicola (Cinara strobi)]
MKNNYLHIFSVAPMLKYTDIHCLFFYRQLTKKTLLYTEMITTKQILFQKKSFNKKQIKNCNPIAIQLAGNNPLDLSRCAKIAYKNGFNEINLNIGCPSKNAQKGNFGVCLMHTPILVYQLVKSIYLVVPIPISLKIRIGTNEKNNYNFLYKFIKITSKNKYCIKFIIHARSANLKFSSPRKNRTIPPLQYHFVYQIKKDFPNLIIIINGGIKSIKEIKHHLKYVDGVMIGREIYKNPFFLNHIEKEIFLQKKDFLLKKFLKNMSVYITQEVKHGTSIIHIIKHILNIFYKHPQSKKWKIYILNYIKHKTDINYLFTKIYKTLKYDHK